MPSSEDRYPSPILCVIALPSDGPRLTRLSLPPTVAGLDVGDRVVIEGHGVSYAAYVVGTPGQLAVETLDDWGIDKDQTEVGSGRGTPAIRRLADGEKGAGWIWNDESREIELGDGQSAAAPRSDSESTEDAN